MWRCAVRCAGLLLLAAACGAQSAAASAGETASEATLLIERAIRAQGGERALREVRALHALGEFEGLGGFSGSFEFWHEQPLRHRLLWDIGYVREERGFDGVAGWQRNASIRELQGSQLLGVRRAALLFPLLAYREARHPATAHWGAQGEWMLEFVLSGGRREQFSIDPQTYLLQVEGRWEARAEGLEELTTHYGDYRRMGNVRLAHRIETTGPELGARLHVKRFALNPRLPIGFFSNPEAHRFSAPYELRIATIPHRLYKEADGLSVAPWQRLSGIVYHATESWTADFLIDERHGRYVEPERAVLDVYSGARLLERHEFTQPYLQRLQEWSVARLAPQPEIYNFRHTLGSALVLNADRLVYTFTGFTPAGEALSARHEAALEDYRPKSRLAFPLKGRFLIVTGHDHYELAHKFEWSQGFALDIVALGERCELVRGEGARSEDYVGFATAEVLAPAGGTVVYARNDVPDHEMRPELLRRPDGLAAIGSNLIIIDHGQGEYSLLAHLQQGSVRVRTGERVVKGQLLGHMGSSGGPGLPHLHYQLQSRPTLFNGDGLPARFENVEAMAWTDRGQREVLKRGVYYLAASGTGNKGESP